MTYTDAQIAQVCHEANRTLQTLHVTMGDKSVPVSPPWWSMTEPDREGIIAGVRGVIEGETPEQSHEAWCEHKRALGWKYGPVKNPHALLHPCLVEYDQLPAEQRRKDHLFAAIVHTLAGPVDGAEVRERWEREALQVDEAALEPLRAKLQQHPGTGKAMQAVEQPADGTWSTPISQPPRIGDVVHYVSYGTPGGEYSRECRAAVVTEVSGEHSSTNGVMVPKVGLCVLNPTGQFFNRDMHADNGRPDNEGGTNLCAGLDYRGGTWHRMPD